MSELLRRTAAGAVAAAVLLAALGCGAGTAWEPAEVDPILLDLSAWDAATPEQRESAAEEVDRRQHDMELVTPLARFRCGGIEREVAVFRHDASGLEFSLIPGGTFRMGSAASGYPEETPVHAVRIRSPFLLSRTECTEAAWRTFFEPTSLEDAKSRRPVVCVSFGDVMRVLPPKGFRLPSEAEWEYACRAGATGKWCFGDEEARLREYAFYGAGGTKDRDARPVGEGKPNAFGLLDVHGNVWEWCEDTYRHGYAGAPTDGTALVLPGVEGRVVRGGSYAYNADSARCALRGMSPPDYRNEDLGFRPARSVTR